MEVTFFVAEDALTQIQPDTQRNESGLLDAFDRNRNVIHKAAAKIYRRGLKWSYELSAADF